MTQMDISSIEKERMSLEEIMIAKVTIIPVKETNMSLTHIIQTEEIMRMKMMNSLGNMSRDTKKMMIMWIHFKRNFSKNSEERDTTQMKLMIISRQAEKMKDTIIEVDIEKEDIEVVMAIRIEDRKREIRTGEIKVILPQL
jgi:hypothetical protein